MTEKELKKLSRKQLLELLLLQTERADALQRQLEEAQEQLSRRAVALAEAGTIANASLQLSGVFQAAQSAAEGYLESIRALEAQAQEKAQQMLEQARQECEQLRQDADDYCAEVEKRISQQRALLEDIFHKEEQDT